MWMKARLCGWPASLGKRALGGYPGQTGEILDPAVDDVLVLLEECGLILLERVFDGGEDAGQLLLADLHRAAEAVVRVAVGAAAGDQLLRAENEAARLRTADAPCRH